MHLFLFSNSTAKFFEAFHIDEIFYAKLSIIESDPINELTRIVFSVIFHGLGGRLIIIHLA